MAKKFQEASDCFEKVLEQDPDDFRTREHLTLCYIASNRIPEAVESFSEFLGQYGISSLDRSDESVIFAREMLANWIINSPLTGSYFENAVTRAILCVYCEPDLALSYFKKALEISPENKGLQKLIRILSTVEKKNLH